MNGSISRRSALVGGALAVANAFVRGRPTLGSTRGDTAATGDERASASAGTPCVTWEYDDFARVISFTEPMEAPGSCYHF